MSIVYLGIGSNIGDRSKNIQNAFDYLEAHNVCIDQSASIIETEPVDGPKQGKYLNTVIRTTTDLHPLELLYVLKAIEKRMGRTQTVLNGPRIIDLDILLYDDLNVSSSQITIPHPRMFDRSFVMESLNEIAPHISKESIYANH